MSNRWDCGANTNGGSWGICEGAYVSISVKGELTDLRASLLFLSYAATGFFCMRYSWMYLPSSSMRAETEFIPKSL